MCKEAGAAGASMMVQECRLCTFAMISRQALNIQYEQAGE